MAINLLTITKEANDYFTFVLNGDTVNAIKNTRNDLTMVGNFAHIKTSNGANLISQQDVLYNNITIVDGVTSLVPTSPDDLFAKLISVNYFDWFTGGGSGGTDRFDELLDTFSYFGKDGQILRVNESELKLETFVLPSTDYLNNFPSPLVALKMLRVNSAGTAYEFVDAPAGLNGYNELFTYVSGVQEFTLGSGAKINLIFYNNYPLKKDIDYTISGNLITILPIITLISGDEIVAIGNI